MSKLPALSANNETNNNNDDDNDNNSDNHNSKDAATKNGERGSSRSDRHGRRLGFGPSTWSRLVALRCNLGPRCGYFTPNLRRRDSEQAKKPAEGSRRRYPRRSRASGIFRFLQGTGARRARVRGGARPGGVHEQRARASREGLAGRRLGLLATVLLPRQREQPLRGDGLTLAAAGLPTGPLGAHYFIDENFVTVTLSNHFLLFAVQRNFTG